MHSSPDEIETLISLKEIFLCLLPHARYFSSLFYSFISSHWSCLTVILSFVVIHLAPMCPEPFQTLAFICEEKNDLEKAHQVRRLHFPRSSNLGLCTEFQGQKAKRENGHHRQSCLMNFKTDL